MQHHTTVILGVLLALAALLIGCDPREEFTLPSEGSKCVDQSECLTGDGELFYCDLYQRTCQAKRVRNQSCQQDYECRGDHDLYCIASECRPLAFHPLDACDSDHDIPVELLSERRCICQRAMIKSGGSCTKPSQCENLADTCSTQTGKCQLRLVEDQTGCNVSSDCAAPLVCEQGTCVTPQAAGRTCESSSACRDHESCQGGLCASQTRADYCTN